MSWGCRLVGDALADLKALDIELQEVVLDGLERLCAAPPEPRTPAGDSEVVHDFERRAGRRRHVVFMRLRRDEPRATLTVLGIAVWETPLSG